MDSDARDDAEPAAGTMPYLLTPGPLTTSVATKHAMLSDWGSRDIEFRALVASVRTQLLELAHAGRGYECVLMQGSGTFSIEAALSSFIPQEARALIAMNGAYGKRAEKILRRLGRDVVILDKGDTAQFTGADIADALDRDPAVSHVFAVHCETTSGIVNPLEEICAEIKSLGRTIIVDAMSSFGALPIDMEASAIDVLVSSANKCIEGVPGFGYVLCRRDLLEASAGRSHSVSLDLFEQWQNMESSGQFRFTPPTHALVAFATALEEHAREGGVAGRGARYARNRDILIEAMRALGFETLLADDIAGPIIQTFLTPRDPAFEFDRFCEELRTRGYAIYPGKLTARDSFRIGTIGRIDETVMRGAVDAIAETLQLMGVEDLSPA